MYIDKDGNTWFKGNLHTHTTCSDGRLDPEAVISMYQNGGYDFLALTDHWKRSQTMLQKDFLLLSGCEYDMGKTVQQGIFHIVGVGMKADPGLERGSALTPQKTVDAINNAGGIAILAHPAWSLDRPEDILAVDGLSGVEIYNSVSARPWNARPYSGAFVDALAVEGKRIPCMAADDSHFYSGDEMNSFLMVKAQELTEEAILQSIRTGDFYATQGPRFTIEKTGGVIHVTCSPVSEVVFFSDTVYAHDRVTKGNGICEAWYEVKPTDTFVRAELLDENGKMAWSSPVYIRKY